ncbi:MAG: MFS transporter [Deltaproteobacteria bacterium]|nr:MFS transporter [Deltaproteobacteria bacterium]
MASGEGQEPSTLPVGQRFLTDVPVRLDQLPWSFWHWKVVIALGITWILDGLEVTVVSAVSAVLIEPGTLGLTEKQIGLAGSAYLAGAISGALLFGRLTDRLGRKHLFLVTLTLYLLAALATALAWNFASFAIFRALTGAAIGGEYAAINSAIDELLPARVRGRADLAINGSYWAGTILGALASLAMLDTTWIPHAIGWRLTFGLGVLLGGAILLIRRHLPESPRWLLLHGRVQEAGKVVDEIEREVEKSAGAIPHMRYGQVHLTVKGSIGFGQIARTLLAHHRARTLLGLSLMVAQAFAYNAIFFTYALVLTRFYAVPAGRAGAYLLPFAVGNLLGPLILGHFFDTLGRRVMITATYALSGVLLLGTGLLFVHGSLNAATQTLCWSAVFFVASAAASSAYLTVSELFPVEMRGMAIALFYAVGTAAGGLAAPTLFGALIQSGSRERVFLGYAIGAILMIGAALCALVLGVAAEGKSLEALAGEPTASEAPEPGDVDSRHA